jgi:Uma2 family endonuclease
MTTIVTPGPNLTALPDHTQLPDKDGVPVRNSQEPWQSALLSDSLEPVLRQRYPDGNYFIGQDCGIYWRWTEPPLLGCKSPDWYLVPDVPRLLGGQVRRSYVLWQELVPPLIVLEYVSGDGSEERDQTPGEGKFWVYERRIRPAFYGIYEVDPGRVEMYHLIEDRFEQMAANEHGRYPLMSLGVELGIWQGTFANYELPWLRWWDAQGNLLPTPEEEAERQRQRAEHEHQRAEQERQRAEQERQQAERLAAKLRALGVDPDQL